MEESKPKTPHSGLWINKTILYSNLTSLEKIILSDIFEISKKGVFFKTNKVIADMLCVSIATVERSFTSMYKKELIWSKISYPYGNHKKQRNVYIQSEIVIFNILKNLKNE